MILKKKNSKKFFFDSNIINKLLYIYFFLSVSVGILFLIFFFTSYKFKVKTEELFEFLSKAGRIEYINLPKISWMAFKSNFYSLPQADIELNFNEILKLEEDRLKAIEQGYLGLKDELNEVNGSIVYKNKKIPVRLRLKGDREKHYINKKDSSYKVSIKGEERFFGMKNFSIQKPAIRNYIHEWIFHELMGEFDIIKLNYIFFDLKINGSDHGLFVIEEGMSKELIERNNRRYGPIFNALDELHNNENPLLEVYNKKFWYKPENIDLASSANIKLKQFLSGDRELEDTFDLEKFAAFFAVLDATYTYHAISFLYNSKLFYNPINGLFEPVPFDGHRQLPNYHKFNKSFYDRIIGESIFSPEDLDNPKMISQITQTRWFWISKFFLKKDKSINQDFYNLYVKYLKKISSKKFIENFYLERKKRIEKINSHIYADVSFYSTSRGYGSGLYYFDINDLFHRSKIIRDKIDSENKALNIIQKGNSLEINLGFDTKFANEKKQHNIILRNLFCKKEINKKKITFDKQLEFSNSSIYSTIIPVNLENIDLKNCNNFEFYDVVNNEFFFLKLDNFNSDINFSSFFSEKNSKSFEKYFLKIDRNLILKSDKVVINENIYIPAGFKIILSPGQEIILTNNSLIISKSPWYSNGTSKDSVTIRGNKNNFGGGLLLLETEETSNFYYTNFKYLSGYVLNFYDTNSKKYFSNKISLSDKKKNSFNEEINQIQLNLTNEELKIYGAISFHKANVNLSNTKFENIYSEDALNIVNSNFRIKNSKFKNNYSDAIDFDFSNGSIENLNFETIGNDALDFSGSEVLIKKVKFNEIGDKIISVGENSKIQINEIIGYDSFLGVASKDGSFVNLDNIFFDNVKIPLASYNKKKAYDDGFINIQNIDFNNYLVKWIRDKRSKIFFENEETGIIQEDIISLIYEKNFNSLNYN